MNILMATMKMDIGGAETHILELARQLTREGHQVTVVSNGGAYVPELEASGIRHVIAPLHDKRPDHLFRSKKILRELIAGGQYDIVHAHARIPGFLLGQLHKKMKFTFVSTAHWVFNTKFGLKYLTDWGEKTVAVSEDIKTYLMDHYGVPSSDIRVTINGIDTDKFSPETDTSDIRREFGLEERDNTIVYISRMDASRSLSAKHLIEAVPELDQKIEHLRVVIVGGGDDFARVQSMAEQVNRALGRNCIVLTGARTDINKFAALAKLFIGVSRAALEAMAAEKPVVIVGNEGYIGLFDQSKLQIGIDTNFCCRGCPESSVARIRDDVLRFFALSPQEQKALGEYGRELILREYSVARMAADTMCVYRWALSKQKEILISGYYGYRNSGDDAMLQSLVQELRAQYPSPNLVVLSNRPDETCRQLRVKSINRYAIFSLLSHMKQADMLLFGGGTLLQDRTSIKSLHYYLFMLNSAKRHGLKVMLYANGLGPLDSPASIKMVRRVLEKADLITLRDEDSVALLRQIGVKNPNVYCTADPVFTLSCSADGQSESDFSAQLKDKRCILVSVRNSPECPAGFEDMIAAACNYASERYGLLPLLIPMQPKKDFPIMKRIHDRLSCPAFLLERNCSVTEILHLLQHAELCLGMRLHSLIYSAIAGIPMIGLEYDPKVGSFLKRVQGTSAGTISELQAQTLFRCIDSVMESYDEKKKAVIENTRELVSLAHRNASLAIELYCKDSTAEE